MSLVFKDCEYSSSNKMSVYHWEKTMDAVLVLTAGNYPIQPTPPNYVF